MPLEDQEATDRLFKALAARPRREILELLATGAAQDDDRCCGSDEACACVFAERLGLGAPTISHHMRILQEADLISAEKRGLWVYYRLKPQTLERVAELLGELMPQGARQASREGGCC